MLLTVKDPKRDSKDNSKRQQTFNQVIPIYEPLRLFNLRSKVVFKPKSAKEPSNMFLTVKDPKRDSNDISKRHQALDHTITIYITLRLATPLTLKAKKIDAKNNEIARWAHLQTLPRKKH